MTENKATNIQAPARPIRPLPQAVADRIAAGEVVERPAAVVKELVENALDAGAATISVIIQDAGRTLIKVVDDGVGMSAEDLKLAIGRHATSKLTRIEDLDTLSTFGFRGEALPAIAAVSRLEIVSRRSDGEIGAVLKTAGGRVEKCEPCATPQGTSVSVGHLYFNVPARRKFLRSDATELKWIVNVFRCFAIAFPEIHWRLFKDGESLLDLPTTTARGRMASLFGDDIAEDLVEINHERGSMRISGFITPPSLTMRSNQDQYLFINRRPIISPRLVKAVYNACEPYFTSGGHPLFTVMMEAPPDTFDINVHPAKKEVKFADEGGVYSNVWAAVRNAITANRMPAELVSDAARSGDAKVSPAVPMDRPVIARANVAAPPHLTPYFAIPRHHNAPPGAALPFPAAPQRSGLMTGGGDTGESIADEESSRADTPADDKFNPTIWQAFDTYILSPLKTGLVVIDQHIAHERILYEKALAAMERMPWPSQQLLFAPVVSVRNEDAALIEEIQPLLRAMGFELERFGPTEFRIASFPTGLRISSERDAFLGILDEYRYNRTTASDPRHRLAAAFACKGAIKAGQPLSTDEMRTLIENLFQTQDPEFCPHGRPIYHVISLREIEKWFKR